jgi:hypothetical protein
LPLANSGFAARFHNVRIPALLGVFTCAARLSPLANLRGAAFASSEFAQHGFRLLRICATRLSPLANLRDAAFAPCEFARRGFRISLRRISCGTFVCI